MKTEREKMLAGELYDACDAELLRSECRQGALSAVQQPVADGFCSIQYIGVHHVGVNDRDTFDLIEFMAPNGDTLLYDAYLGTSIMPEQFEPHYEEAIYWEFNYSNL